MDMHNRRTRRRALVALAATTSSVAALTLFPSTAYAVHDLTFQLDGDVSASTTTNVGGHTQTLDWDSLFTSAGTKVNPLPTGFNAATFSKDFTTNPNGSFSTADPTTFTTGSKDTLPISTGWQCTASNNVNSKIDVMNAYAGAYKDPATGDEILYFALERNTNTGDANVAFWFLQGAVGCNDNGGTASFTGDHQDGDLLIVSAFTNGGTVSTIDVYRWNGGATGSLGTTAVAHGVDCKTTGGNDTACATVNTGTITTPWLTATKQDGVGHSLRISDFFEGGLNLTKANLAGKCFNTFTGDTRSSQSLTATLFDYALGTLGECTSNTTTQASITGSASIGTGSVTVSDSATVTVTGATTWAGTVQFKLTGPDGPLSTSPNIGSPVAVSNLVPTVTSVNATVTAVGHYCWSAAFTSTTEGVPNSHDDGTNECFDITPVTPTLATTAGDDVLLGNPITDTATLTGTANEPGTPAINPTTAGGPAGGTITFTAYGPNDCTTVAFTSSPVAVAGDGTYGPVSFTPTAIGTYHWAAVYSGDSPNTNGTSHNLDCSDANEDVVVTSVASSMTSAQSFIPNDSATVSAPQGGNLAGSVTFKVFESSDCSGNAIYTQTLSVSGLSPQTVSTTNTTISTTAANVSWFVNYDSTNPAQRDIPAQCFEKTVLNIDNDGTVTSP